MKPNRQEPRWREDRRAREKVTVESLERARRAERAEMWEAVGVWSIMIVGTWLAAYGGWTLVQWVWIALSGGE